MNSVFCVTQVKSVKPALKQLQQSIQTITQLHSDEGMYYMYVTLGTNLHNMQVLNVFLRELSWNYTYHVILLHKKSE